MTILSAMSTDTHVGRRINDLLFASDMNQTELAAALDLDQSTLSKKIRGRRRWSALEVVLAANALEVSVTDILPAEPLEMDMPGTLVKSPAVAAMSDGESRLSESNRRPFHYE